MKDAVILLLEDRLVGGRGFGVEKGVVLSAERFWSSAVVLIVSIKKSSSLAFDAGRPLAAGCRVEGRRRRRRVIFDGVCPFHMMCHTNSILVSTSTNKNGNCNLPVIDLLELDDRTGTTKFRAKRRQRSKLRVETR